MLSLVAGGFLLSLLAVGCKQGLGDRCETNSDCESNACLCMGTDLQNGRCVPDLNSTSSCPTSTGGAGGAGGAGGGAGTSTTTDAQADQGADSSPEAATDAGDLDAPADLAPAEAGS